MLKNHDLLHEFPNYADQIHELKVSDNHFRKLFDEYHDANDEIHRIESGAENTDDKVLTDLRKQRLSLKDELYNIIRKNENERAE